MDLDSIKSPRKATIKNLGKMPNSLGFVLLKSLSMMISIVPMKYTYVVTIIVRCPGRFCRQLILVHFSMSIFLK